MYRLFIESLALAMKVLPCVVGLGKGHCGFCIIGLEVRLVVEGILL